MSESLQCTLSYLSGNFYECSPVFVHQDDLILFASGSIINLVSSTTGNIVGVFRDHHNIVTAIGLRESASGGSTVYSSSVDGTILVWNLKTLAVEATYNVGVAVYDIVSIMEDLAAGNNLIIITNSGSKKQPSTETKKKFSAVKYDTTSKKTTTKLSSLQFPRRCTGVLQVPATKLIGAAGELLSLDAHSGSDSTVIMESILVVASSRKISFIPLTNHCKRDVTKVSGVVHFIPDADNRRGAITCLSVGSHDEGVLVTGHEKGGIVVWHNITQYYLQALAQATQNAYAKTVAASNTVEESGADSKNKEKSKKHHKQARDRENTMAMPVSTTLHWHAHAVHCMSLTADGTTLYSGGAEGVLVVWHNVNTSSSTGAAKSFFPRLGCPISFLSNNSSASLIGGISVAVTTTDNCVHVINTASMREDWAVRSVCVTSRRESVPKRRELKQHLDADAATDIAVAETSASVAEEDEHQYLGVNRSALSRLQAHTLPFIQSDYHWRCNVAVEPRSQWLVCNGYPGQLQAFDRATQSLSHSYQVVDYVRVSKKEANSKMYVPSISHSQFLQHPLGSFMGTVDVRKGAELEAENSLKFWEYSDVTAKYRLGAQMDNPHGTSRITALAFAGASDSVTTSSNSNKAAVVCATASVDGTVKVWRAERNEVPPQPTLSTTAKRNQQQLQLQQAQQAQSGSTSTSTSAAAAVVPLKWSCAYSFKYRDTAATALAFSRDGSLLAVAHRNLLTLWDPVTVTMKASIVCPSSSSTQSSSNSSSNSILYTAFIEPRASACLGGGNGSAYLFVATQQSISVYDLLTLKAVWTQSGDKFTAFAVAPSEDYLLTAANSAAWIAVALSADCATGTSTTAKEGNDTDSEVASVDSATARNSKNSLQSGPEQHKVLLFSPYSSLPLSSRAVPAKVSSLTFCPGSNSGGSGTAAPAEGARRGIAMVTESSELLFLSLGGGDSGAVSDGGKIRQLAPTVGEQTANVYKVTVPALSAGHQQEMYDTSSAKSKQQAAVPQSATLQPSKPGWLRDYFDEHSENIPSLGALSSGFFSNFKSTAPAPTLSASPNATGTVADVAAAAERLNRKRSAQQMSTSSSASVTTKPVPQQVWDEALIPFFSGAVSAASTVATTAAKEVEAAVSVGTPSKSKKGKKATAEAVEVVAVPAVAAASPAAAVAPSVSASPAVATPVVVAAPVEKLVDTPTPVTVDSNVVKTGKSKGKSSKIPVAAASTLQTIQEDEEMVVVEEESAPEDPAAASVEEEEAAAAGDAKRRKTTRSNSVASVASTTSTAADTAAAAAKSTRASAAASKIPARAPRVAASPSTATATMAITATATAKAVNAAPASKIATKVVKSAAAVSALTKRSLAAVAEVPSDSEISSMASGAVRRSTRARAGSNLSEDSVASSVASRRSTRSTQQQ